MTEKDFISDELTATNDEYLSKIKDLEAKDKQSSRIIADLNKDLINEHERMGDRLKSAEKKSFDLEDKIAYQANLIRQLRGELELIENKDKEYFAE